MLSGKNKYRPPCNKRRQSRFHSFFSLIRPDNGGHTGGITLPLQGALHTTLTETGSHPVTRPRWLSGIGLLFPFTADKCSAAAGLPAASCLYSIILAFRSGCVKFFCRLSVSLPLIQARNRHSHHKTGTAFSDAAPASH